MRHVLALALAVAVAGAVSAAAPDAKDRGANHEGLAVAATIVPDTLEVGQPATYTLRIELPRAAGEPDVQWKPEPFEVLQEENPVRRSEGDRTVETRSYQIATYQIEKGWVPPPRVVFVAGADTLGAAADTIPIVFRSTLSAAGDTALAPLKPPRAFPRRFPWLAAALALLALALAAGAFLLWRRLRRRPRAAAAPRPAPVPVDTRPAHVIAIEALDALEARRYPQQGLMREHSTGLSEIARRYLGMRYGFDALDSTSFEVMRALAPRALGTEDLTIVRGLLAATDWVKFAKGAPTVEEALALLGQARLLVEHTREREPAAVGSGA
jgi:hypothetical protein